MLAAARRVAGLGPPGSERAFAEIQTASRSNLR
jgi:hypothetical protein